MAVPFTRCHHYACREQRPLLESAVLVVVMVVLASASAFDLDHGLLALEIPNDYPWSWHRLATTTTTMAIRWI
jgi:hypothetical protein